jgi:hypothetical protein
MNLSLLSQYKMIFYQAVAAKACEPFDVLLSVVAISFIFEAPFVQVFFREVFAGEGRYLSCLPLCLDNRSTRS